MQAGKPQQRIQSHEAGPTSAGDKYSQVLSHSSCCTGLYKSGQEQPSIKRERGTENLRESGMQDRREGERDTA